MYRFIVIVLEIAVAVVGAFDIGMLLYGGW